MKCCLKNNSVRGLARLIQLQLPVILNSIFFITATQGTHFRGGTVWWKPSQLFSEDVKQIQVEYQIGWRVSFNSNIMCNDDLIHHKNVTGGLGEWQTEQGQVAEISVMCAEYDPDFDWMMGYNRFFYNVTSQNVTMWFVGRCWVGELFYTGCEWSLSFMANIGIRSDTGKPNSSPKSGSMPIIRVQVGCPITIKIPTTDPDGDSVTCRFGKNYQECGEVCISFPYFSINQDLCELTYNGGGSEAMVSVAIIIEDHPDKTIYLNDGSTSGVEFSSADSLSYVPLQFLVALVSSDNPCNARPSFTDDTPPDGQVVTAITGVVYEMAVFAKPSATNESITDISFIFPFGSSKSALKQLDDNAFRMNVTWEPSIEQVGNNLLCFIAKDSVGLSSVQRCITVVVGGASSPCSINNGGCSDECITISSASYYCDCPRKCWYLATDGRTCKPNFEIDCGNQRMDIVVPTCAVDSSILSVGYHASLVNPTPEECKVQIDEDFYNFSISYSQCQMHVWETFWEITYSNTVRLWAESLSENSNSTNNVITRGAWYLVPVSCTFFKFGNVTTFFKPEDQQVALLSVPGMGAFSFSLDFYNSSTFNEAVGPYDYPLTFTVNSDIYFGVRAVGGGANMQIFTINCVALPNTNDDSLLYTMISDGCLLDATMVQYPSSSSMENHFSIKAFKFRESLPSPDGPTIVHISCSVMVCTDNLQITRCSQGCVNTDISVRKKRSSNNKFYRFKRQVVDDDDDDDDQSVDLNVTESPIQQVASRDINIVLDINLHLKRKLPMETPHQLLFLLQLEWLV
ncbi:uncharacterized protein LOC143448710 isoform X2 [Clavelina lepadiformis]|uniref:uncharacterized protein LOC143448710 isoform X2 n=1 Tax=Clavelina lepadiformis TaxID=159417 RepID=UPI004042D83D